MSHHAPSTTSGGHAAGHHDHSNDWKLYLGILLALLVLTVVTVAAASFDFGSANVIIAVLIATCKATLVALFFMHLRHDSPVNAIIFLSSLLFLSFLLILCIIDIGSRIEPKPANWKGPSPGLISPADLDKPVVPAGTAPAAGAAPAAAPAPKH
ncbi:MAG: cytochrome C oxidase subunit IV family protein [Acidobacteria bacterium]|nr:cytochrome C oxidase subunit IV family protein [Acidobacteriota bacterium]